MSYGTSRAVGVLKIRRAPIIKSKTKKEKYDTNIFISFWNNQLPVSQPLNSISDLPEKRIKEEKASPNMDEPYYHKWMLYLCIIFIIILYLYSKNFLHIHVHTQHNNKKKF